MTRIGKFLRKTSLDEVPQILNIFLEQMSILGPRPDTVDWAERYTEEQKVFLRAKPGISGYSQAYFRNSIDIQGKIKNDVFYVNNISLWFDIKIFFKTIATVLSRDKVFVEGSPPTDVIEEGAEKCEGNVADYIVSGEVNDKADEVLEIELLTKKPIKDKIPESIDDKVVEEIADNGKNL